MNFSDYFYIAGNMCLVAQQNMFLSWGKITLSGCRLLAGLRAWRLGEVGQHLLNIYNTNKMKNLTTILLASLWTTVSMFANSYVYKPLLNTNM
jgi:hypothetical protein